MLRINVFCESGFCMDDEVWMTNMGTYRQPAVLCLACTYLRRHVVGKAPSRGICGIFFFFCLLQ